MPLVLANRVQETGTANTTVSFTLAGAVTGFQSFAVIGNTNTTYYSATDGAGNWEVGLGTYSTTGPTLTRTTVYASSNSGSAVTFSGVVSVFVTYPSGKSVNLDGSGNVSALGTVSSGTWQGSTIGVAYGGTGVTTSSGANSVVLRDANSNISVNRISQGLQTITASGGTTTLTAASQFNQALVGTGGHTFRLPDATTLTDTTTFQFNNNATGTLTIQNNAGTTVGTIATGGAAGIALLSNATVGGTWDVHAYIPENVTWGTNSLALGSTVITGGTWNGGTITPAYGGTGLTSFTTNGAVYATGTTTLTSGTLPVVSGGTGVTTSTGSGNVVLSTSPTLVTPLLGTPTSGNFSTGTFTWPTFNQNTTGTAANVTGTVAIANGGTGQITRQDAMDALAGAVTSGQYLRGNGADVVMSAIQAADVPTLNQNTTGTAANVTGVVAVANGGTGQTTYTNGQLLIGNTTGGTLTKTTLSAGTGITITNGAGSITIASSVTPVTSVTGTSPVVSSGGTTPAISLASGYGDTQNPYASKTANFVLAAPSGVAGAPTFRAVVAADIPTLNQNTTGSAGSVTNSVTFNNGGAGGASGSTFNGSGALTVSYNTVGAPSTTGTNASGTWNISVSGNAATATTAATANSLNTGNAYTGTSFTASDGTNGYFYANRSATANQAGIQFRTGGATNWYNYLDNGSNTLAWYQTNTNTQVMTLTQAGVLNVVGNITQSGSQVLTAGNYNSYAPTLTGGGASGTWSINVTGSSGSTTGNAATATNVAGLVQNSFTSYGNTATTTTKGGYYGLLLGNSSGHLNLMADSSGFGGIYRESAGQWVQYYNATNNCTAFGGSTTASGYTIYANNSIYSTSAITAAGSVRGPIFYDSDNTAYYTDPASTSNILGLLTTDAVSNNQNGLRNISPGGGSYVTATSSISGAIRITLPQNVYPMIRFTVRVYTYDGLSFDIYCGGHTSSSIWYNTFAYMGTQNRSFLNVRFSSGGGNMYVYIGDLGSTWSYPQVFITDVQVGYSNYEYDRWDNGWAIAFDTASYNTVYATQAVYPSTSSANNTYAAYASIFYDANNTSYYADPASTSNLVGLTVANTITGSISGNAATATSATTATNVAGGAANRIVYNTAAGTSAFVVAPTTSSTYLSWNGTAFAWAAVSSGGVTVSDDTSTNATRYLTFTSATSGSISTVNVSSTKLTYNPSTGVLSSTTLTASSDARLKTNWRGLPNNLVEQLTTVKSGVYDRTDTDKPVTQVGVSAQSLQDVIPNAVVEDVDGMLSVAYGNAALVAAIELAKRVVEQEARINRLEALIEQLIGDQK